MHHLMSSARSTHQPARRLAFALAVAMKRLRYWTYSGILDASRVAWRGDTGASEHGMGTLTMVMGIWWAAWPQPLSSVFGWLDHSISAALPAPFGFAFGSIIGVAFAAVGRNMLHQLVQGSIRCRCQAAQIAFAAWLFLFVNQLFLRPQSIGTVIFAMGMIFNVWIHERCFNGPEGAMLQRVRVKAGQVKTEPGQDGGDASDN